MFTFISYWRTAAVVLCDLASTAYYIGGAVESAVGPSAPWFILAVMLFSYAVRSVYIESCSLFVRGGVYRVVKEAMGGFLAKLSVSALMFDYILTGPTSGVSAGQYIMGLLIDSASIIWPDLPLSESDAKLIKRWGSVLIACAVTLYFFRQNLIGIHESSGKALKIMIATTVMAGVDSHLVYTDAHRQGPGQPDALAHSRPQPKVEYKEVEVEDSDTNKEPKVAARDDDGKLVREWMRWPATQAPVPKKKPRSGHRTTMASSSPTWTRTASPDPRSTRLPNGRKIRSASFRQLCPDLAETTAHTARRLAVSFLGVIGLFIAFGHSILAMSGEETLAQVYREVESPKLPNFKKAAFIVFVYSLVLTASDQLPRRAAHPRRRPHEELLRQPHRRPGHERARAGHAPGCCSNAFVVVVGFLILAGAVNTAIIGSNGVLNRVAEDGVLPDWFLKPHPRYGTTYRLLYLIVGLQLFTILVSRGNMLILGEAYAFGVVWSFVFKAAGDGGAALQGSHGLANTRCRSTSASAASRSRSA